MYLGKNPDSFSCQPISLNGGPLEFVSEWKYLGVTLTSDNGFYCSAKKPRSSFYCSVNSVLNVMRKPSQVVLMKLLYSICVPIVTYACDVATYHYKEKQSLHVAVNDAIRRIYSYDRWESVKTLHESLGYLSVTQMFAERKESFKNNLSRSVILFLLLCRFYLDFVFCVACCMLLRQNLMRIKTHIISHI